MAGAEGRRGTLLLLLLLVLVAATHAFVVSGRTPSTSSCRCRVMTMRATRPPSSSSNDTPASSYSPRVSRGEWVQGIAGVAGVGAVALGGERAVRAAQEEQQVLVRRPVLSERLYDTHRRSYLPVDQNLLKSNRALDHPVVCVGEVHDDDQNHYAEYAILKVRMMTRVRKLRVAGSRLQGPWLCPAGKTRVHTTHIIRWL